MAAQCDPQCPKMIERRQIYEEKLARKKQLKKKTVVTDDEITASGESLDVSNETEYLSVPGVDSSSKDAKEHIKKHVDYADRIQKPHKKYQTESHSRPRTPRPKKVQIDGGESADVDRPISRRGSHSQFCPPRRKRRIRYVAKGDRSCENEECSGKRKRERIVTYSSETSSSDISCPALCEVDESKLPEPKQRCEPDCPAQIRADKRREVHQEAADRYVLYGGWRYFDDLCHCSLRCLLLQICNDKYVQKTALSALFFSMGLKLCCELNGWFIRF